MISSSESAPPAPARTPRPYQNILLAGVALEGSLKRRHGFTLIELSIVLVIIGLIVGGVLVGQDLIRAAETRAQITQIEKYNSAVNTFKAKFNAIPGDMTPTTAQQFGFTVGSYCYGNAPGLRNGDGLLDGNAIPVPAQGQCETGLFWVDLSSNAAGNLIDGTFPGAGASITCGSVVTVTGTVLNSYIPQAKIGHANYVYAYETSGSNWYGLSAVTSIAALGASFSNTTLPVIQAYNIDRKIDDGLPLTGNVQGVYVNNAGVTNAPNTTTSSGTSSSCYDTTTSTYSITVNNGNGGNCALSFRFQ